MAQSSEKKLLLITGAAGFSGHHMVAEAVKAGYAVRATDISSRHYGAMFDALDVQFIASDLTRPQGLDQLVKGVDGIIHVAGIHDYSTPDAIIRAINVTAVENLCQAAVAEGVKGFVHWSSVAVYGYDWHGQPVDEDAPKLTPPWNNYNQSKWDGEQIVLRYWKEKGLPAAILRPAAIYGSRSEYGLFNAFKEIYKQRHKKKLLMVGSGDKTEAFVHVRDMCRASLHACNNKSMVGEAYNVSDDSRITTCEFFNLISRELFGVEKEFTHVPLAALVPVARASQFLARKINRKPFLEKATLQYLSFDRIWDNTKLKSTGFEFLYPLVEPGLVETVEWYKNNGWFKI